MRKFYTNEFKLLVIQEYKFCANLDNILSKYQIACSTLYDWIKFFNVINEEEKITYKDFLTIKKQLEKKSRELEIIERTHCFKDSPRQQKLEAVEKLYGEYPTREMCRVLNLDHGTFLNHHYRRVKITQNAKRDEMLKVEIIRVFEESERRFGATKICHKLQSEGIKVSLDKVSALMKELQLKNKHRNKKKSFEPQKGLRYNNIKNSLNRQFNQTEPNRFWVSDTTNVWVGLARFHLCVIIELFSRKVIAYRLSSQDNANLIINTFKDAFEIRGRPSNLTFHSDKGNGYVSGEFRSLLYSLKVNQSCSKSGNPYDNAVIESFFSNMKRDELNSHNFELFDELKECIDKYMHYYNSYRPHRSLKNKTPDQVEHEFYDRDLPDKSD